VDYIETYLEAREIRARDYYSFDGQKTDSRIG